MTKKVIIELSLVDESRNKVNQQIVDEIFSDISEGRIIIPWCKKVEKVVVIEDSINC
ncbi:MAG: hypothetical protein NWE94_01100 [Candidatus Bathyarchaeota archaeon]|nr:hypothetical protein [Candidatus Bathyarchaeota archaeon]